ncbi:protein phosphatase 2C domain-containing protein [Streptomyces sp. CC210A]|uniref:protein phosphatase 2C domain-containing protein n=1 Tax=Streptomyces sp. CC210A TaxID=2898184 RepID=UPI0035A99C48
MRFAKVPRPEVGAARRPAPAAVPPRPVPYVGDGPPTYDAEPTALPQAWPHELDEAVPDTVLEGARYGSFTLRAASVRGDSARYRGESRRDALLAARFGTGDGALVLVAVATGARGVDGAHVAARDACRWIGEAVGRSHARLADDIRAGRREDLKSGLHRLTDRAYGRLRARAAELGFPYDAYTADLRCLLLPADAACRNRIFFGVGSGGLFRLRGGAWQDLEPPAPEPGAVTGAPVVGYGSPLPGTGAAAPGNATAADAAATGSGTVPPQDVPVPETDGRTMRLGVTPHPGTPYIEGPLPPPAVPFRFRASIARPGDALLLASTGLAEPLRCEPALAAELATRWAPTGPGEPPGLAAFLADTQLRVKGYADDRTAAGVWEA